MYGAIFDLDGTILDSMGFWSNIGDIFLRTKNINIKESINDKVKGLSFSDAAIYLKEEFNLKENVEDIINQINMLIENNYKYHIPLKPYVLHFLNRLKKNNYKMCIATASYDYLAMHAIKRLNIENYFDFLITTNDVGAEKCESALIYEEAVKKLDTKKEKTIIFEDSLSAIRTAKEAGFYVVGVSDPSSEGEKDEIKKTADKFIKSFKSYKL